MMPKRSLPLIGYASGIAGATTECERGPQVLKDSLSLAKAAIPLEWRAMIQPIDDTLRPDEGVHAVCELLANHASKLIRDGQFFNVIGGDHTSAIGLWSGVYDALHTKGEIGLIWIDAHMDSHTPETTESGRIHGMPLACLMGYGYSSLTSILHHEPKIKPENICLIGVRSFESGEAALLKKLNVRIYFMDEINQRGCAAVLHEAVKKVS